jgi:Neuraminidase (sialidase)
VASATDPKKTGGKPLVVSSFSDDHGRTWSEPQRLIDSRPEHDYDPGLIVFGTSVIVTSTTTPSTHGHFISTSRTVAVRSDDNGRTWSSPFEIPMGHRYTAGKINNGIELKDGTLLFPFGWDMNLEQTKQLPGEGQQECVASVMISRDRGRRERETRCPEGQGSSARDQRNRRAGPCALPR